jgi:hypothetical protein
MNWHKILQAARALGIIIGICLLPYLGYMWWKTAGEDPCNYYPHPPCHTQQLRDYR